MSKVSMTESKPQNENTFSGLFIFLQQWTRFPFLSCLIPFPILLLCETWLATVRGKKKNSWKAKESTQKLPLARAMLMHVLHHICAKVVEEEWRVKPLWIRCFISAGVYIFHPVPPSPRLSALWFFSFFCLLKELTVLHSVSALSVCAVHCSLLLQCDEKSLK